MLRVGQCHFLTFRINSTSSGLIRARDNLLAEQRELGKQKPRGKTDEALIAEISSLESNLTVAKDDLVSFNYPKTSGKLIDAFHRERVNCVSLVSRMNSNT
jgi:hypothetical protein